MKFILMLVASIIAASCASQSERSEYSNIQKEEMLQKLNRQIKLAKYEADLEERRLKNKLPPEQSSRIINSANAYGVYKEYFQGYAKRIELVANTNYPTEIRGKSGTVRVMAKIKYDGSVDKVKILKSSGDILLDKHSEKFVFLASPFDKFPESIKSDYHYLEIIRSFKYESGRN